MHSTGAMEEIQSFRLVETSDVTQLTLHHRPDGQVLVPWKDIERTFPGVSPTPNSISVIKFLRGADYERINQCSRSMDVVLTTYQPLPIKSGPVGDQANNPIRVSVAAAETTSPSSATSTINTTFLDTSLDPVSGTTGSSKVTSSEQIVPQAPGMLPETEDERQPSSAKGLKDGHQEQELGEPDQSTEASVVKNSKMQDEVHRLQQGISAILEVVKRLEKQALCNQDEMKESQQETLPQIGVLRSRVQSILIQNYELHEYPISRLFAVLPQDPSGWDSLNPFSNKFRLYFLCECGEHTKSIKSTGRHEIHFAKHEGYEIARPSKFFQQYGHYILTLLKMLKVGISVAGVAVPALSNLFPSDTIGKARISLTQLRYNIEHGMDLMISLMEKISVNEGEAVDEFGEDMEKKEMEGSDLRKLGAFLKNKDDQKVLGNLYRAVTDKGHIKWVCIDHYRVNYQESSAKEFQHLLSSIGGSFSENDGRVVVKLRSSMLAHQFYSALGRATLVYELDIDFDWACTSSDLEALEGALRNSGVSVLRLDLQRFRTSDTSNLLPTPAQYEVIFRIRDLPQVKAIHIIHSYENIEFLGICPNTATHVSSISCELKLRAIKGERTDIGIITKALKTNSNLTTLYLYHNNIGDDGARALAEALKINLTLTSLNLNDNSINDNGAKALAVALKINSTLTTLSLECNNIEGDGAEALAEAIKISSTLTTLDLSTNNIGVDGAKALAEALKINPILATLNLNDNNIEDNGAKALAEALKINSNLTTLDLKQNNIEDNGAEALADALKINSNLNTLYLSTNNTGVNGAKALAEALKINSNLATLYLYHNNIGVEGAKALADALKINSTLTTLNLHANNIGVDGAKALAEALKINSTLITLNLRANYIRVDGAKALAEALKINSNLTTLNLYQNNIKDTGAEALAEALKINSNRTILSQETTNN